MACAAFSCMEVVWHVRGAAAELTSAQRPLPASATLLSSPTDCAVSVCAVGLRCAGALPFRSTRYTTHSPQHSLAALLLLLLLSAVFSTTDRLSADCVCGAVVQVCLSIQLLLQNPNPDDPLDPTIASHWKRDANDSQRVAREWTRRYAQ